MDNTSFAEGYRTIPWHTHADTIHRPEVKKIMAAPRKWSTFFDRQMYSYLNDRQVDEPDEVELGLQEYYGSWLLPHLDQTVEQAQFLASNNKPRSDSSMTELTFHILNKELFTQWHSLLLPDRYRPHTPEEIQDIQVRLAIYNAENILKMRIDLNARRTPGETSQVFKARGGQASEVDAAIIFLEVVKRSILNQETSDAPNPLVLLPSPPQFESGYNNSSRAADFIIIDPVLKQSRGIQIKSGGFISSSVTTRTTYEGTQIEGYDPEYVTMIDGMVDLGNTRYDARTQKTYPNPGLISLEFLRDRVSIEEVKQHPVLRFYLKDVKRVQAFAHNTWKNRSPGIDSVVDRVGAKIIQDLYQNKNAPVEITEAVS